MGQMISMSIFLGDMSQFIAIYWNIDIFEGINLEMFHRVLDSFNLICNMTMIWKSWILTFWPYPQGRGVGGPFNLICNMTMIWKSWISTFWPHPQGRGQVKVWGLNICYHIAAFVIPFNLISNMTIFWQSWILTFWPPGSGWWGVCRQNNCYHVAAHVIWYVFDHVLKTLNFDLLTPPPVFGMGEGGAKNLLPCWCNFDSL